jgi:outer membrane protein assembly factor BamD
LLYNKPAIFWYQQIIKEIKNLDLEKADEYYTSLSGEHISSPLLHEAMLILSNAHIDEEEYILANFYIDEFMKKYRDKKSSDYGAFLKIKANFESFKYQNRNQQLLLDTIKETRKFANEYPDSQFRPMVDTILIKLELANLQLTQEIASLYERVDKPKAHQIYKKRAQSSPIKKISATKVEVPWYRALFE